MCAQTLGKRWQAYVVKERSAPHICTDNDKSETENQPCSTGYQPYCFDNKLGEP